LPRHEKTRKLEINRDDLETNWLVRRRNEFEVKIYRPKVLRIIAGDDIVTFAMRRKPRMFLEDQTA
jgi:hypothetical protein